MGRPKKLPERTAPTVGEAIEDVRDGLAMVERVLAELSARIEKLRVLHKHRWPS